MSKLNTKEAFIKHRDFLYNMGARIIVVSEQGGSIQGQMNTPVFEKKPIFTEDEWKKLAEGLEKLGALANEKGMKRLTVFRSRLRGSDIKAPTWKIPLHLTANRRHQRYFPKDLFPQRDVE